MNLFVLYLFVCVLAAGLVTLFVPVLKKSTGKFLVDVPAGPLKKHAKPTSIVGGCAIFLSTLISLTVIRLITAFPTGTLHNLRGIFIGGTLIFVMGLVDDLRKPKGLSYPVKLAVEALAAGALVYYGITLEFLPGWLGNTLAFLWLVGLTNAFNLLDIQDGLCVSQCVICTLGLSLISLPSEFIYVNFAALALLGACLAFWPHNHSHAKVFLGDSGALFLGFMIAALSMGTGYSGRVSCGFLAPLFILAVPLFDTCFVMLARLLKGKNPLKGSNDHIALRLLRRGYSKRAVLGLFTVAGLICNTLAFWLTYASWRTAALLLAAVAVAGLVLTRRLLSYD